MNLDWLTCLQNFEVPLQVVNETWFKLYSMKGFKIEFEFKASYTLTGTP
jgi:hypothetical protein